MENTNGGSSSEITRLGKVKPLVKTDRERILALLDDRIAYWKHTIASGTKNIYPQGAYDEALEIEKQIKTIMNGANDK